MVQDKHNYYVVREDILPEGILKTVQAKELLARGEVSTIHEAVEKVDLSRSAFYKYKDRVHPINKLERERIITVGMDLTHRSGILSKVLSMIANHDGNVLTINQTIPLQGMANVTISMDATQMGPKVDELMHALRSHEGVKRASILGEGGSLSFDS
ncbi:ACT domain-containing protein [Paenibacillus sp. N1-5-1-14]|uniref:ACT domain-containing protein n=1 Tax=Paenibacillus radicibacter TaxID=2972488 RepID=UPI00215969ED|nr:ACT domain-containing protein [Paenibacillus radicibacter]MCR8644128.1 ACT domain-containing protein [Paenibacillus radicibacter]